MELSVEKVRYRMSPSTIITPAFSEMSKNPLSSLSSSLDTAALFEQTDFWKGRDLEEMTVGEALGVDSSKTLGNIRSWIEKAILEEDKKKVVERKKRNLERMVEEIHKKKSTRSWESAEQRESGAHLHGEKGTGKPSSDFETREEGEGEFEGKEIFKCAAAAARHDKKIHKKVEKDIKEKVPFGCVECGKQFASLFQLREHVSILHLRERKFACEVCGQKFGRRGGVRRHVQMVHLNQTHKCPYADCDHPGYKCSKALTAHIRSVHTNVRPYKCEECGKDFVRRNDLKMHEQTHNDTANFQCACGSSFRRPMNLKKHQKSCGVHNDDSPDDVESSE